ncbi:hypothetical protein [Deinococcus ruber]|uniref:Uncharacterized protein n=1 Tax=Deinococcus ruber TaxID=1848197 RepID=A0A918CMR9_9DEIO|nr:hypothetical protein [Deinococcus ruber]GGR31206.1 hypothetical protein GCM10008957_47330 [Deinococcus ruber]
MNPAWVLLISFGIFGLLLWLDNAEKMREARAHEKYRPLRDLYEKEDADLLDGEQ